MKILLLGCDGQIGWELQRALIPRGQVIALTRAGRGELCGDLTKLDLLAQTVHRLAPDIIVNAAAYTAVDKAEAELELAELVNVHAPGILAESALKLNAWLVHYSTDYVFDGTGEQPWREGDPTNPCNVYGHTKLGGEDAIRESGCNHLIFRTSWIYSPLGKNFLRTVLRLLSQGKRQLRFVNDQFGAPTAAEFVADVTAQALAVVREAPRKGGTYHLSAGGVTTWYQYAKYILEHSGSDKADAYTVESVTTEAFKSPAKRPLNSRLCCDRVEAELQIYRPDWHIGVSRALKELSVRHRARL